MQLITRHTTHLLVNSTSLFTIDAERRDEGREHNHAHVGEQLGDFTNTTNVLGAFFLREAEILAESMSHIVAIQSIGGNAELNECLLESKRDGRFAGAR